MVDRLWQMSLLACAVIGFVLLLRLLLKRCSKGYSYGLWLLVLLRLLCPALIESGYSAQPVALTGEFAKETEQQDLGQRLKGQYALGQQVQGDNRLSDNAGVPVGGGAGHGMGWQGQTGVDGNAGNGTYGEGTAMNVPIIYDLTGQQSPASSQNLTPLGKRAAGSSYSLRAADPGLSAWERGWRQWVPRLRGIYLLGTAVLLLYFAALYFGWKRRLSAAVRQRGNIWYSEQVSSPFVLGVLRPRIYLPYGLDAQEESYILLHEQTHIQHMDPLLRLLGTFSLCLHWWNPLVWLGIHCFYQDMEMFCDEAAMGGAELPDRRAYAETLLHFAIRQSGPGMALAFGETHTEQRIRNILRPKRHGRLITLVVALAAVLGGTVFLTVPQTSRAEGGGDLSGKSSVSVGELSGQSGSGTGEMDEHSVPGAGTGQQEQGANAGNSWDPSDREFEKIQNLVLSQTRFSPVEGQNLTLQLVLTEGVYYTREQAPESLFAENYEGSYQLRTLDEQGRVLNTVDLENDQGGEVMNFPCRDFSWYFEDYNLDGRQDFFLGTKAANRRSYHYLMTVTDQGEFTYLYDGPMWEGYWPLAAENITDIKLESGGGEHDFRTLFLYQTNLEYSSHDFYTWSPYFEQYRKSVVFIDVYPEGQDQEALNYLEGSWRISGVDMWDQDQPRPSNRIGRCCAMKTAVSGRWIRRGMWFMNMPLRAPVLCCKARKNSGIPTICVSQVTMRNR